MRLNAPFKLSHFIFGIFFIFTASNLRGQTFLKIDAVKAMTLYQFDLALEHDILPNLSLHHQLNIPSITKLSLDLFKPYQAVYASEFRVHSTEKTNTLFIGPALRIAAYKNFTDYELGATAGFKAISKNGIHFLELKFGLTRSLNYLEDNDPFGVRPSQINFLSNLMIGFVL